MREINWSRSYLLIISNVWEKKITASLNLIDGVIKDTCNRPEFAAVVDESYSVELNPKNERDALLSSVFTGVPLGQL